MTFDLLFNYTYDKFREAKIESIDHCILIINISQEDIEIFHIGDPFEYRYFYTRSTAIYWTFQVSILNNPKL